LKNFGHHRELICEGGRLKVKEGPQIKFMLCMAEESAAEYPGGLPGGYHMTGFQPCGS
jgi:hypothetical protein